MNKSILFIGYSVSPKSGVGGRRWNKFLNEFLARGIRVHIICVSGDQELNYHALANCQIIPNTYPKILSSNPSSYKQKLQYKFHQKWRSFRYYGTPYDLCKGEIDAFLMNAKRTINELQIRNVIVSGAPFSLFKVGRLLKNAFDINLIIDYRDPWTTGDGYGMNIISKRKKREERIEERMVLDVADHVIVASEDIKLRLTNVKNIKTKNIHVITNGHSFAKHIGSTQQINRSDKNIRLMHIGSIKKPLECYWRNILDILENLNSHGSINLSFDFFGCDNEDLRNYCSKLNLSFVTFYPRLNETELHRKMPDYDFFVLFKKSDFPNTFPTKFFDYIMFRKPLICYTVQGLFSKEIEEERIGFTLNENSTSDDFRKNIKTLNTSFNFNYDTDKFSVKKTTKRIVDLLVEKIAGNKNT